MLSNQSAIQSMATPTRLSPRLLHPLMGANLRTLWQIATRNGGVAPECLPQLALAAGATVLRWPFTAYERGLVARSPLPADTPPPIFIIGHWRSGTTFLYNLLSRSPQFAYVSPLATGLPWDFLTLARLVKPILERALPKERFIDNVQVNPDSPQEDEIGLASMQVLSFYHGLYFPKNFQDNVATGLFFDRCSPEEIAEWQQAAREFFKKLQLQYPKRQLLIKNPVYTGRVAMLRQMYPNAKFIHIYRNPYTVFQSTRNFYHKLFKELALQPYAEAPVDEVILESYPRMMNALFADSADLGDRTFIELRFEEFETDPLGNLERIYTTLEIPGFEVAKPEFATYLGAVSGYQKNRYAFPQEAIDLVRERWQPFLKRWGYQPPA